MEGAIYMPNYRYQAQDCQRWQGRGCPGQGMQQGIQRRENTQQTSLRQGAVCKRDSQQLADMPVAMAYVPWQEWYGIFDLEKALCCGTIFEELNKPFTGAGGRR